MPAQSAKVTPFERRTYSRLAQPLRGTLSFGGLPEACRVTGLTPWGAELDRPAFAPVLGERVELFLADAGWFTLTVTRVDEDRLSLEFVWFDDPRLRDLLSQRTNTLH